MDYFFELTRRCNMNCSHCLRGDIENQNMKRHIMVAAMDRAQEIEDRMDCGLSYGFGGGEITTAPKALSDFAQEAWWKSMNFSSFWVVSNGVTLSKRNRWAHQCIDALNDIALNTDEFWLAISIDDWHDRNAAFRRKAEVEEFVMMKGYSQDIEVCDHGATQDIIYMGRAEYGRDINIYVQSFEDAMFYVTVNGDVFPSCDLSYEFMDEAKSLGSPLYLGNVTKDNGEALINNWKKLNNFTDDGILYINKTTFFVD